MLNIEYDKEPPSRARSTPGSSVAGPERALAGITQPIAAWTDAVEALESGGKVGELLEIELGGDRFYG